MAPADGRRDDADKIMAAATEEEGSCSSKDRRGSGRQRVRDAEKQQTAAKISLAARHTSFNTLRWIFSYNIIVRPYPPLLHLSHGGDLAWELTDHALTRGWRGMAE